MQLSPPAEALDSRSLYHISVHANVFKPQSHITVVHRGASSAAPYVGEFEYGPYDRVNRIIVGTIAKRFSDVAQFTSPVRKAGQLWNGLKWRCNEVLIHWEPDTEDVVPGRSVRLCFKCTARDLKFPSQVLAHYATFYPSGILSAREGITPMPSIVFEQPGLRVTDHILLSVLVLQRYDYPCPSASSH
ncbi:hypothetical protein PsYK624_144000 [Phanerochaete sordida]|uniref:Uncharacterized protein n=1 Tax=Phanerochaete sordida TaxID=48140 RepID=A0A9P3GLU7_9APHY|nr:hypothetical protein PsYK624_144000 [Phanerochaete sordida]